MVEEIATKTVQPIDRAFPAEKAKAWHYKIQPYHEVSNMIVKS